MRGGRLKNNMKTMPTHLAKYTILKSEKDGVRLSSHFSNLQLPYLTILIMQTIASLV